jgi:hypothetical protein
MKVLSATFTILIISAILQVFLPWWIVAPVALAISFLFKLKPGEAFLAGFLGVFILWAGYAFYLDMGNNHILCKRIAALLHLSIPMLILLITGAVGGLVAGFGGLAGSFLSDRKAA